MVHVPAPVMWTVEPLTVQLPVAAKLTARPEDAVALTLKSASPKVLPRRAPKVIVWSALLTVSVPVPLLAAMVNSPAKLAPTALGYGPALMPERLTPASVATPLESVEGQAGVLLTPQTAVPFRVKLTVLPLKGVLPDLSSVAVRAAVELKRPLPERFEIEEVAGVAQGTGVKLVGVSRKACVCAAWFGSGWKRP